jgi:hypothetical protein
MKTANQMKKHKGKTGIKAWMDIAKAQLTDLTNFWYENIELF